MQHSSDSLEDNNTFTGWSFSSALMYISHFSVGHFSKALVTLSKKAMLFYLDTSHDTDTIR